MNHLLYHIAVMILPLLLSNIIHMYMVKTNGLQILEIPINRKAFGRNKTLRGFIVLPLMNALVLFALNWLFHLELNHSLFLGFVLGLAYMAFELPNSFIKRRLGIESGATHRKHVAIFKLMDKMDSAFGVTLTYFLLGNADILTSVVLFVISSLTHIMFSYLLYLIKLKKTF